MSTALVTRVICNYCCMRAPTMTIYYNYSYNVNKLIMHLMIFDNFRIVPILLLDMIHLAHYFK